MYPICTAPTGSTAVSAASNTDSSTTSRRRFLRFNRSFSVQDDRKVPTKHVDKGPGNGVLRKGSRSGRSKSQKRGTLAGISSLTFSQKQALITSWRLIKPQANSLLRKILLELEITSPKVKQIFYKAALVDAFNKDEENIATLEAHIKLITRFLDEILLSLDDEANCLQRMKEVGSAHSILSKSCHFSCDIWEHLGEVAMERICTHESVQKTREAARAWRTFLACLTDQLRTGFEEEVRLQRKSSSNEHLNGSPADILEGEVVEDLNEKVRQLRMDYDRSLPFQP